jgi:hypothetical protein
MVASLYPQPRDRDPTEFRAKAMTFFRWRIVA